MKKTFEDESDALSAQPTQPTTEQPAATTAPGPAAGEAAVPLAGNGAPDYRHLEIKTEPELPREVEPGGSATEPESGGGYSG